MSFTFRRLVDDDLELMHRWLNEPGIVTWWEGDDVSWEGVVKDYGSANDEPVERYMALRDDQPFGWIQAYAVREDPSGPKWFAVGVDHDAAGIDYFVAEPAARGQGLGSQMIRSFVAGVVFAAGSSYSQACAGPMLANAASWRALQRAGFRELGLVEEPLGTTKIMAIDRGDVVGN